MKDKEYLTQEEQFKEVISIGEIDRIRDTELREIRREFWNKRHQAFLNEKAIPDCKLADVVKRIIEEEQNEIAKFRNPQDIK